MMLNSQKPAQQRPTVYHKYNNLPNDDEPSAYIGTMAILAVIFVILIAAFVNNERTDQQETINALEKKIRILNNKMESDAKLLKIPC